MQAMLVGEELARGVVMARRAAAAPPPPPLTPPGPFIAAVNEAQPDALVFLGLALSCAIPFGHVVRVAEDGDWSFEYERYPLWLLAAYLAAGAAFALMFFHGNESSALGHQHWVLAAVVYACSLRHSHRVCESPKRHATAVVLSFMVAFSVVFAFKCSLRTRRCSSTLLVLVLFCSAPAWRLYARHRVDDVADARVRSARRRCHYLTLVVLLSVALQPWLGVCGTPSAWAATTQMLLDMGALALATDSLW